MNAYVDQARLIKSMAHPTRLRILDILAREEACVCHLTAILKQRQPYVSQHLMALREADLVRDRRDGVIVYYRLAGAHVAKAMSLLCEALSALGTRVESSEIPPSPVVGCPCPKCRESATLSG